MTTQSPQNQEAELVILSSILLSPEIYDTISQKIRTTDFYNSKNALMYDAFVQLANAGRPLDEINLLEQLRETGNEDRCGGLPAIYALQDTQGSMLAASFAADKLKQCTKRRQVIKLCREAVEKINEGSIDIEAIASSLDTELVTMSDDQTGEFDLGKCLETATTQLTTRGNELIIPHGIDTFDNGITDGGLKAGQMHTIGARPGRGKTTFALNIAGRSCTNGLGVGIISLEMTDVELVKKMICMGSSVNFDKFKDRLQTLDEQSRLEATRERIANWNLHISDNGYMTVDDIMAKARGWKRRHGINLLIIDYLQLIKSTVTAASREQQVAAMSRKIKLMAKTLEIPVIILAQLSRGCEQEDRQPKLTDLRESGAIEQDSDICTFLYNLKEDVNPAGHVDILRWIRPKQRNGTPGAYGKFRFNGAAGVIGDIK